MEKYEIEIMLGCKIRQDEYLLVERIHNGESYENIKRDLEENRMKYNIPFSYEIQNYQNILQLYGMIYINPVQNKSVDKGGVYGIYINDQLIYIGKTVMGFQQRFEAHQRNLKRGYKNKLYDLIRDAKEINAAVQLRVLLDRDKMNKYCNVELKDRDINAMEYALIELYQPICNTEGVDRNYRFDRK